MVTFLLLFALLFVGFALLAAAQFQHRRAMGLGHAPASGFARMTSGLLMFVALALALWRDGSGLGTLLWGTSMSLAATSVTATLSWRPRWLAPLARRIG